MTPTHISVSNVRNRLPESESVFSNKFSHPKIKLKVNLKIGGKIFSKTKYIPQSQNYFLYGSAMTNLELNAKILQAIFVSTDALL